MCQGRLKGHSGPHNFVEPDGKVHVPPPPPRELTLDEKLEVIAARMQSDCAWWMEWALDDPSNLNQLYSRATEKRTLMFSLPWR